MTEATQETVAMPLWAVFPFVVYLLTIAIAPLVHAHFWESNRNKLFTALLISTPVLVFLLGVHPQGIQWLLHSVREYAAFMTLLASLYVISGGIYVRGSLAGTPIMNTAFLAFGALLASVIGTTGASMVFIRPLLRANAPRVRKVHVVVFFIFIVSNGSGLLTPLGDPPLFLGFLRGVPFFWTLRLFGPWLLVNGALLLIFNLVDQQIFNREELQRPGSQLEEVQQVKEPITVQGRLNFFFLLGVVAIVYVTGAFGARISTNSTVVVGLQVAGMGLMAFLSYTLTTREIHAANRFSWAPIAEVAVIFVGIFLTMVPALHYLEAQGAALGVTKPWQFFWASGLLSSFLDNAPTYLTFATLAVGVVNQTAGSHMNADQLADLAAHPTGALLLVAVSCGSVFMGANSYIGNGPNFMVKAIAEENGVRMPSFFGYMAWSVGILLPIFAVVTLLFFR